MKKVLLFLLCLGYYIANAQSSFVYFETDKYDLTKEAKIILDSIINDIKTNGHPLEEIALYGHTDIDANEAYNQELSLNRTRAVRNYFKAAGINNRFHTESFGEKKTVNENKDENEKQKNRRVEIIRHYSTNNDVFSSFKEPTQLFLIDPKRDTTLILKKGTIIRIDKEIFKNIDYFQPLKVEVQEYNSMNDYILSNLTTNSTGSDFLESRGMINLNITQNEKTLELRDNKNVDIIFKDRKFGDNTQLFYGNHNNDNVVWEESNSKSDRLYPYGWMATIIQYDTVKKSEWKIELIDEEPYKIIKHYTYKKGKKKFVGIDTLNYASDSLMEHLVLKVNKFGLINCDRFSNNPAPRVALVIEYEADYVPNVILAFDEINAMLPYSYREGNKFYYENLPENLNARIIGMYKAKKSDDIYLANQIITVKKDAITKIEFTKETQKSIKNKIGRL